MKTDALRHPKTRRLKRLLGLTQFETIGLLEGLFQWACLYANDGRVGKWPAADLADFLEWSRDADELLAAFRSAGWIDGEGAAATIHDWRDHCPRYITQRLDRLPAAANGDQQAPLSAAGGLPSQNPQNPQNPQEKKTVELDQVWEKIKATQGLALNGKPLRRCSTRDDQVAAMIADHGVEKITAALASFPLAESKLMFSHCAPHPFAPTLKFLANHIDDIIDGLYSEKPRPTAQEIRRRDIARQIKNAKREIASAQQENDRLYFESNLTRREQEFPAAGGERAAC